MNILERFEYEFNELVNITYDTYWELNPLPREKFSNILCETLKTSLMGKERSFDLSKEDLKQHLSLLWLSYYRQYQSKKPETSLKGYILRRSIWGIRDWLSYEMNIVTEFYDPDLKEENFDFGFKLDLIFLLQGSDFNFLKGLSPYERYIIFLKFKEEKSILQMSHILQKDRRVIKNHFDSIILKLKENHSDGLQNK